MDPHRNIFYYYRGPSSKHGTKEHQVEDNSTKSLINLLENGGPEIQRTFFSHIDNNLKSAPKKFQLQVGQGESRPDAIIDFPDQLLLIEVKVRSDLDTQQLKRHIEMGQKASSKKIQLLVITRNETDADLIQNEPMLKENRVVFRTWNEIYEVFNHLLTVRLKKKDSKESFLLAEFLKYLELMDLKPFTKLTKDDFDYFYDLDDDYGRILKEKIKTIAEEIQKQSLIGFPAFSQEYPNIEEGNIKKRAKDGKRVWVKFVKPKDSSHFNTSNFCITLCEENLSLNLVLSGQRRTKRGYPIYHFDRYLNDTERAVKLFSKLEGMTLTIFERNDGIPGHPPSHGARDVWKTRIAIETEFLKTPEGIKFLQSVLKEIDFPGINLGPIYPKNEVIIETKEKIVGDMSKKMPLLYEALKEIKGSA